MQHIHLKVSGISCQHCVNSIQKSLSQLESVQSIQIDIPTGTITFEYEETKTPLALIMDQIEELGFEIQL